jgi:hypothetical protein
LITNGSAMKTREEQEKNNSAAWDLEKEDLGELKEAIVAFRNCLRSAAEKPNVFWEQQHNAIMLKLNQPAPVKIFRSAWIWATAAALLFACILFFPSNAKPQRIDLAAGSDQILLIEIERALNRQCPEALVPTPAVEQK